MQRYDQLDSLRGIAALVVIMCHAVGMCLTLSPVLSYTPLYLLFGAGHEAVVFFFILSGFVLSLPFNNGVQVSYFSYLIKRIFRIYLPFAIAMSITLFLCFLLFQGGVQNYGEWLRTKWSEEVTFGVVWHQLNLFSNHETTVYNPVVWSLITEMRVSIIFPFLMLFINRFTWVGSLLLALCCSILGGINATFHLENSLGTQTSFLDSIHFTSLFIIGALLAKHHTFLTKIYLNLTKNKKWLLLLIAFFVYTYSRSLKILHFPFLEVFIDWGIALGVTIIIVFSLSEPKAIHFLTKNSFTFIGKISYSLYLYHIVVLFTAAHLLYRFTNSWVTVLLSVIPIFVVSYAAWRWVELPSIKIGKLLARGIVKESSSREKLQEVS